MPLADRLRASGGAKVDLTGIIAMFNTTSLPAGWNLCDGTNGTPDLRAKFIVGAGNTYAVGATGGAETVTLDTTMMPAHNHNGSLSTLNTTHTHLAVSDGDHSHTSSAGTAGHSHTDSAIGGHTSVVNMADGADLAAFVRQTSSANTDAPAEANHPAVSSNSSVTHTHSSNSDFHSHNVSLGNTGSGGAHENRPPYYALVYAQATSQATVSSGIIGISEFSSLTGWNECNGLNGTPDLRTRFIIGVDGTTYLLGGTGGAATVTLTSATFPSHNHNSGSNSSSHSHNVNAQSHAHTVDFSNHSTHSHSSTNVVGPHVNAQRALASGGTSASCQSATSSGAIDSASTPAHNVNLTSMSVPHSHNASVGGAHGHSPSINSAGSDTAHENRPPYYAAKFFQSAAQADNFPTGIILMWSGSTPPEGYVLCNGQNGTADLRDKFIVGVGTGYLLGATGGANQVTLNIAEMPGHSHNVSSGNVGDHSHTLTSDNMTHSHTATSSTHTSHGHNSNRGTVNLITRISGVSGVTGVYRANNTAASYSSHNHNHTCGVFNNAHSHSLVGDGVHSHSISSDNSGGGLAHNNLPPYYALAYIQKAA